MDYKTPGVYIEEIAKFPPSVATAETAIPAFVGYTQKAETSNGVSVLNTPTRISSLLDYQLLFGGGYAPAIYTVRIDTAPNANNNLLSLIPEASRRFYLFDSIRHYFDNGGGPCYIVSVGFYRASNGTLNQIDPTLMQAGLKTLEKVDEPTLLLFPDAVGFMNGVNPSPVALGTLQAMALAQCQKLKDRFVIMDTMGGGVPPAIGQDPAADFRTNVGNNDLKYGAAYYPWLQSTYQTNFGFRNLIIQNAANNPLDQAALENLTGNAALKALVTAVFSRQTDTTSVINTIGGATYSTFSPLSKRYDNLVAAFQNGPTRTAFGNIFAFLRSTAIGFQNLDVAPFQPNLAASVDRLKNDSALVAAIANLVRIEKNPDIMNQLMLPADGTRAATNVNTDYAPLNNTAWVGNVTLLSILPTPETTINIAGQPNTILARGNFVVNTPVFVSIKNKLMASLEQIFTEAVQAETNAEQALFAQHPVFQGISERIKYDMSLLPPSGAVAGIYAATDRSRGVWKAPANVSFAAVTGPAVKVSEQDQASLNVHDSGKTLNAIRSFTGKGTLLWGARTLAGNDNEWRYVPVRRFFNFVEESVKKSTERFVFESNDANTWVKVRAMIENFLTVQWRQGALAGATTREAFYVKVGLNETMTPNDILEGRMIVEIGMAAVRPAEFIVLRFSHKLQES